jgi:hypothetical protein
LGGALATAGKRSVYGILADRAVFMQSAAAPGAIASFVEEKCIVSA